VTVGTGIFLSSLFLGFIGLYIKTKDQWKWKRIGAWIAGTVVFVSSVSALILYSGNIRNEVVLLLPAHAETGLWGVELGISEDDLFFLKGSPKSTSDGHKDTLWTKWHNYEGGYRVATNAEGTVGLVIFKEARWADDGIQGIRIGDSLEVLIDKFGEPSTITKNKGGDASKWRRYDYPNFGISFVLAKSKVSSYGVRYFEGEKNDISKSSIK
jgi:hypothetical protein